MITVNIGRTFLDAYNQKYQQQYSAKSFFENVYFELFFNHEKYMQWPTNSPFVQGVSSSKTGRYGLLETIKDEKDKTRLFKDDLELENFLETHIDLRSDVLEVKSRSKKGIKILKELNDIERTKKLEEFKLKVSNAYTGKNIDASIAIGFPAAQDKEFATTSGLVGLERVEAKEDDIYLSWIGAGLSVGVAGGYSLLFNKPEILLETFNGWRVYRTFLNDPSLQRLAPNKITSWNGQWLNYVYGKYYRENFDFMLLDNLSFFKTSNSGTVINPVKWSELFFSLSRQFPNESETAYIFSLGQMNKTLGFYPFRFRQAKNLISYYKLLFGENNALKDSNSFEQLYGIHIKRACELGALGLQALEPEGLRKYFDKDKIPQFKKVKASIKKDYTNEEIQRAEREAEEKDYKKNIIPYRTYKTWLFAMITKNKEEMVDYTVAIAEALHDCRAYSKKTGSTKISNQIKEILTTSSKMKFISSLTELIQNENIPKDRLEIFYELKNRVHLMTAEDFKYLITLIKFDYTYLNRTK